MCRRLFLNLLHEKFTDKEQFEKILDYPTLKDAAQGAMNLIAALATKHGIKEKFSFTPSKAPPHAFIFPENKSVEEIKTRIIFSHYNHPGKEWGRKVGRAISTLILTAKDIIPTWAMLDIREVKGYATELQKALDKEPPPPPPARALQKTENTKDKMCTFLSWM